MNQRKPSPSFAMKVQESVMPRAVRAFRIPAVLESPTHRMEAISLAEVSETEVSEADWEEGDEAVWLTNAEVEESVSVLKRTVR